MVKEFVFMLLCSACSSTISQKSTNNDVVFSSTKLNVGNTWAIETPMWNNHTKEAAKANTKDYRVELLLASEDQESMLTVTTVAWPGNADEYAPLMLRAIRNAGLNVIDERIELFTGNLNASWINFVAKKRSLFSTLNVAKDHTGYSVYCIGPINEADKNVTEQTIDVCQRTLESFTLLR